jgi:signal peptidase I
LPVLNRKVVTNHEPQRGDVVVFRYPPDPRLDYIKRVVGLPGDEVAYLNKQLTINGREVATQRDGEYYDEERLAYKQQLTERLGSVEHRVLVDQRRPPSIYPELDRYPFRDNCRYSAEGVVCKVPQGHYFVMGDNRDNSQDSRFWGFVPDENLVGKAFFVWMNFGNLGRIGAFH